MPRNAVPRNTARPYRTSPGLKENTEVYLYYMYVCNLQHDLPWDNIFFSPKLLSEWRSLTQGHAVRTLYRLLL